MINIKNINNSAPYKRFEEEYLKASKKNQPNIEAVLISSYNKNINEVDARFVNLKYINEDEWIFFSNYDSPKAIQFQSHKQITAIFYWNSINVQIRIKGHIEKSSKHISDIHYSNRGDKKNALAISSQQSKFIKKYDEVVDNYRKVLNDKILLKKRPVNWGGYSFKPYYFEFWEGHESRLNKRTVYENCDGKWKQSILQP